MGEPMEFGLVIAFIAVSLAVCAIAVRIAYEKRNNIGGRNTDEAPGGWFGNG